jgi:hypothetical protein
VQTPEGEKNIEDIKVGDEVLSTDPEQGENGGTVSVQKVVQVFERTATEVVDIQVGGETITATPEHPFWVVGKGWVAAGQLERGSPLQTKGHRIIRVDSVKRREGAFKVYNFEATDHHTYFVSKLHLLVHNQCNKFPSDPADLLPDLPRDAKGRIYPNDYTRIRPEQHPLQPGETFHPRHHGQHYHVEVRIDPTKSWNNSNNVVKIKPPGYTPGEGTGFIPGEQFP